MYLFFNSVAFVEFKKESTARKVRQKKQGVEIQGRVVIVDFVGETIAARSSQATKANDDSNDTKGKLLVIYTVTPCSAICCEVIKKIW